VTIVIGNAGALMQRSLKRLLAWSGVAQAGYLLAGVVVGTQLGLKATFFYLAAYLFMNVAAFAVVVARERVSETGDDLKSFEGSARPARCSPGR
jgi:NADH-quinone oxidoreductase subunit N